MFSDNSLPRLKLQINLQAPVMQAKDIMIQASPAEVWAVLSDISNWIHWNKKITQAQIDGAPTAGTSFRWTVNGAKIHSLVHTSIQGQAFGWSGTTFGGSAIHNWYFEARPEGTLVRVEESMEGWLVKLFQKKMNQDLARDMVYWLERLREESLRGEILRGERRDGRSQRGEERF